jgi:hypothetical protein
MKQCRYIHPVFTQACSWKTLLVITLICVAQEQSNQIGQASKATADITASAFTSRANILLPRSLSKQATQMSAGEQSPGEKNQHHIATKPVSIHRPSSNLFLSNTQLSIR